MRWFLIFVVLHHFFNEIIVYNKISCMNEIWINRQNFGLVTLFCSKCSRKKPQYYSRFHQSRLSVISYKKHLPALSGVSNPLNAINLCFSMPPFATVPICQAPWARVRSPSEGIGSIRYYCIVLPPHVSKVTHLIVIVLSISVLLWLIFEIFLSYEMYKNIFWILDYSIFILRRDFKR